MTLTVGDTVKWKGSWGSDPTQDAKVLSIEINCQNKEGEDVDQVDWSEVHGRRTIVTLDNDHWAYGNQITPVKTF